MQSLFEKVTQGLIEPVDAADIALSLAYLIDEQVRVTHLDPSNIQIGEDNQVSIVPGPYPVDCLFAAPDVVLNGAPASKEAMWFSLGCLLFYMLNKCTYHEMYNLNPFEQAASRPGTSLVDTNRYNKLAADAIGALTSWNPQNRTQGVSLLLQIAEKVPSRAIVRYTCNGQVVATEEIPLKETMENFRAGETVTGSNHTVYAIRSGAVIPFRPGTHPVTVVVDPENDSGGTHVPPVNPSASGNCWLVVVFPLPDESGRTMAKKLLPLTEVAQGKMIPISTTKATKYDFYAVMENPVTKKIIGNKLLFNLQIPAIPNMNRAQMNIHYHTQPKGFSVVIRDQNGKALSNAKHFQMI